MIIVIARFLHHYHYYRLLGQPFARAVRSAWRMRAATPREDTHGAAWPLLTIAGLCLVPIVVGGVGAYFFGWRAVVWGALLYIFGNVTWALVQHLVRAGRGQE